MSFDDNIFDGELVLPTGGWSLRQLHLTNDDLPAFAVQRGGIKYPKPQEAPMLRDIKVLVIPPAGKVYVQFIQPADAAISKIIFGHDFGQVGEFGFGNTLMMVDECAGDNPATTIPNPRATELWNTLSGKHGELDPFENAVLSTVVMVGRDIDGKYTDVQEDVMTYKFKEGTTMAPTGAKRKALERELKAAQELRESLEQRIPELQAQLAKAPVLAPPQGPNKFRVNVTFGPKGKRYEFLLLKTPDGRWFTTGTKPETAEFPSWHKLVEWLEGPEVHWHSDLDVLGADGRAYSFAEGKIVDAGEGDPVF